MGREKYFIDVFGGVSDNSSRAFKNSRIVGYLLHFRTSYHHYIASWDARGHRNISMNAISKGELEEIGDCLNLFGEWLDV